MSLHHNGNLAKPLQLLEALLVVPARMDDTHFQRLQTRLIDYCIHTNEDRFAELFEPTFKAVQVCIF